MAEAAGDDPASGDAAAGSTGSDGLTAAAWLEVSVGVRVCSWGRVGSDECSDGCACGWVLGRRIERVRPVRVRPSSVTVIAARTSVGGTEGSTSLSSGSLPRLGST